MTDSILRQCTRCKNIKSLSEFHKSKTGRGGHRSICKECRAPQSKNYAERTRCRSQRRYALGKRYGMTLEDYEAMVKDQGGVCAICEMPEGASGETLRRSNLAVDHSHETGRVRSLLCTSCNFLVGRLENSGNLVRAARMYLIRHEGVDVFRDDIDPVV